MTSTFVCHYYRDCVQEQVQGRVILNDPFISSKGELPDDKLVRRIEEVNPDTGRRALQLQR